MAEKLLGKQGVKYSLILIIVAMFTISFHSVLDQWDQFSLNFTSFVFVLYLYGKDRDLESSEHTKPAFYMAIFLGFLNSIYYFSIGDYFNYNILHIYGPFLIIVLLAQTVGIFYILNSLFINIFSRKDTEHKVSLKKMWLLLFAFCVMISLVVFAILYPGVYTFDSMRQVEQAVGAIPLNNHHPIFMTLILKVTIEIGQFLGLSNLGIAVYPFLQIIINSIIYATISCYLVYKGVSRKYLYVFLAFIYLNPVTYFYNITVWKDIPLAMTFLIFTVLNTEYILDNEKFLSNKLKVVSYVLIMIIFSLWKGNAIFALILSFIVYIVVIKGRRRLNLALLVIVFAVNSVITGPIYSSLGGEPGEAREALSIFFQQIGGIANSENGEITDEQMEELGKYIDLSTLPNYDPQLSNPIKNYFNEEHYAEDKLGFFKIWFDIIIHNFPQAVEATFEQTSAYYSLPNQKRIYAYGVSESETLGDDAPVPTIKKPFNETSVTVLLSVNKLRRLPMVCDIWSIGLFFWIIVILLYVYTKKYSKTAMLVLMPSLMLWLTIIASPVNGEYRYAYPIILAVSYLLVYVTKKDTANTKLAALEVESEK